MVSAAVGLPQFSLAGNVFSAADLDLSVLRMVGVFSRLRFVRGVTLLRARSDLGR